MTDQLLQLRKLVHLASEPCSEKRRDLLREITDIFLSESESLTERQNWYFGDIMGQIAYDLETQIREELASRLAAEGNAPHELIRRLASDEIAVARPVLQQSPVLTQEDLIEITQSQSQDHLQAITVRPDIGEDLSQALVTHGNDSVVVGLLRNEQAEIGNQTMIEIADRSQKSEQMQEAMVDRSDVPKEILTDMVNFVSEKLRHQLLEQFADVGTEQLDDVIATMKGQLDQEPLSKVERYIEDLVRRGALNESLLMRFLVDEKPIEFMVGFARLTDIDLETARRALSDPSGTPLAILCRANEIGPEVFKEMALSSLTGVASDPDHVLPLVRVYMRLNVANAQRAVRFWRTRKIAIEDMGEVLAGNHAAAV